MKLRTKLTTLCAALLLLVAVSLTAAMLWQVRAQSYDMLLESGNKTLTELSTTFEQSAYRDFPENEVALEPFLTYCFRNCGVPGSALLLDGKCLYAATPIAPEKYLDASNGTAASARAYVQGKHFLILGKALDIREKRAEYTWWRTQAISMPSSGSSAGGSRCWPWSSDCWDWGESSSLSPGPFGLSLS